MAQARHRGAAKALVRFYANDAGVAHTPPHGRSPAEATRLSRRAVDTNAVGSTQGLPIEAEASLREDLEAGRRRSLVMDGSPPTNDLVQRTLNPDGGAVWAVRRHRFDRVRHREDA